VSIDKTGEVAIARTNVAMGLARPVSGAAESTPTVLRRGAVPVGELSFLLTVSLVTVTGVTVTLLGTPPSAHHTALPVFVLGAGAMFGLSLADIAHGRELRFARVLTIAAVLWSLSALTTSQQPLAYSVGHVSQWCVDLAIAYLLLSYPTGRLEGVVERALFASAALLVGLLFLPTALLADFPHPSLWSMCTSACPRNVFSLTHSNPAIVQNGVLPVREVLAVLLFAAIAAILVSKARRAGVLLGQLYAPIAAFGVLQTIVFAVYFPLRALTPASDSLTTVSWIFVLSLPAVALTCGSGRVYRRIHTANVLVGMTAGLAASASAEDVRLTLADALEDPSLRIFHSFPGDPYPWVDECGRPVELEQAALGQRMTSISSGKWRIAVLHDASLLEDRALVLSAGSYALAALENQSLTDELRQSLTDLAKTRTGRLAAEQDAREKMGRDLHDGAQQRLVALRIKLGLTAATLEGRDPASAKALHALESDVEATIDEVRLLAHGIYPPLLARTGLRDALRAVGRVAAVPTVVHAEHLGRYSPEIETTVYFCCSEALQNATKHARTGTLVTIRVWQDSELHFEVRDDGQGFDQSLTPYGTGLSNLRDRLALVGGTMTIASAPGQGTVVGGSIPLP
jgi:signal transduction histidine kinase